MRPANKLDLSQLDRTFTLRASEGFVENFGAQLLGRLATEAPGARLHVLHKLDKIRHRDAAVAAQAAAQPVLRGPQPI